MVLMEKSATVKFLNGLIIDRNYRSGEGDDYLSSVQKIAKDIESSNLPEATLFTVCGYYRVTLLTDGEKKVDLYNIYPDSFGGRSHECKEYCWQHYIEFRGSLRVAEALLGVGKSGLVPPLPHV